MTKMMREPKWREILIKQKNNKQERRRKGNQSIEREREIQKWVGVRRRWGRRGSSSGGGTSGGSIRCSPISSATPRRASASLSLHSASTSSASRSTIASSLHPPPPPPPLITPTLIPSLQPPLLTEEREFSRSGQSPRSNLFLFSVIN